jgi:hypothetical protein
MSMLFNKLSSISKTLLLSAIIIAITALAFNISALLVNASSQAIKTNDLAIKSQFSYLIDNNTLFSVEDIENRANTFVDVQPNNIPYKLSTDTYWVRIEINNTSSSNEAIVIHADNAKLDLLKIYRLNGNNDFDLAFSSLNKSTMTEKIFPHLALTLKGESQSTVLFQISTLGPPSVPLILYRNNSFYNRVQLTQMMFGAFIGIILLMSAYNIILYFAVKDKVYIVYVGYLLASFIVLSSVNGFGHFLFSEDIQAFININSIFFHYLLTIFLLCSFYAMTKVRIKAIYLELYFAAAFL